MLWIRRIWMLNMIGFKFLVFEKKKLKFKDEMKSCNDMNMNVKTYLSETHFVADFSFETEKKFFFTYKVSIPLYDLKNEVYADKNFQYWDSLCKKTICNGTNNEGSGKYFTFAKDDTDTILLEHYNTNPVIKIPFEFCLEAFEKVRKDILDFIITTLQNKAEKDRQLLKERLEKLEALQEHQKFFCAS